MPKRDAGDEDCAIESALGQDRLEEKSSEQQLLDKADAHSEEDSREHRSAIEPGGESLWRTGTVRCRTAARGRERRGMVLARGGCNPDKSVRPARFR